MVDVNKIGQQLASDIKSEVGRQAASEHITLAVANDIAERQRDRCLRQSVELNRENIGEYFAQFPEMFEYVHYETPLYDVLTSALHAAVAHRLAPVLEQAAQEEVSNQSTKEGEMLRLKRAVVPDFPADDGLPY
jgi:hypothetical protein